MEIVNFHYVAEEYDDGEVYFPRKEVIFTHNQEDKGTLNEIVLSFKEFLTALGYLPETVAKLQIVKDEVLTASGGSIGPFRYVGILDEETEF